MLPSAMVTEIQAHDFQDIDANTRIYPLLTSENRRLCALAPTHGDCFRGRGCGIS